MMDSTVLTTDTRSNDLSKGDLNKFRMSGKIPAVIYGKEMEPTHVFISKTQFEKSLSRSGRVFNMSFGNKEHMVNTKEIQRDPLGKTILHVSFQEVRKGQAMTSDVRIHTTGQAVSGGTIVVNRDSLRVSAIPSKVPSSLEIDISSLEIGSTLTASAIRLPEGVSLDASVKADDQVITCMQAKAAEPEETTSQEETTTPVETTEE
jgi:large subunit ribosomal protein L25